MISSVEEEMIIDVSDDVNHAVITGLIPSTEYIILVAAVNDDGTGVYSNSIHTQTEGENYI